MYQPTAAQLFPFNRMTIYNLMTKWQPNIYKRIAQQWNTFDKFSGERNFYLPFRVSSFFVLYLNIYIYGTMLVYVCVYAPGLERFNVFFFYSLSISFYFYYHLIVDSLSHSMKSTSRTHTHTDKYTMLTSNKIHFILNH